jgi:hypothetical protein
MKNMWMSLNDEKIFGVGVGIGVKKKIFFGVGAGIGVKNVDSADHCWSEK